MDRIETHYDHLLTRPYVDAVKLKRGLKIAAVTVGILALIGCILASCLLHPFNHSLAKVIRAHPLACGISIFAVTSIPLALLLYTCMKKHDLQREREFWERVNQPIGSPTICF